MIFIANILGCEEVFIFHENTINYKLRKILFNIILIIRQNDSFVIYPYLKRLVLIMILCLHLIKGL